MESNSSTNPSVERTIGRNEPCPCGSGKKYKRCHGVDAAPKLTEAKPAAPSPSGAPGFDPSKLDPAAVAQITQVLKRLPKSKLQRLQAIMKKGMAGKDVTAEAAEFEKTLPLEFQNMLRSMLPQMLAAQGSGSANQSPGNMSEEEARRIVAEAAQTGKISQEKAESLLSQPAPAPASEEEAGKKKRGLRFWQKS